MATFKGNLITVKNEKLKVGDQLPDFSLVKNDLSRATLKDFSKKKLISIIPSIDTGVCDLQTRRFNEEIGAIKDAELITVSCDLPFAQKRWCMASSITNGEILSDYFDHKFGYDYGVFIEELHILARAIIVADANNKITYIEYLDEMGNHPDYEKAIQALKAIA